MHDTAEADYVYSLVRDNVGHTWMQYHKCTFLHASKANRRFIIIYMYTLCIFDACLKTFRCIESIYIDEPGSSVNNIKNMEQFEDGDMVYAQPQSNGSLSFYKGNDKLQLPFVCSYDTGTKQ